MAKEHVPYIIEQFKAGKTLGDLAKELEVSYQAIHRIVAKNGLKRTDGGKHVQSALPSTPDHLTMPDKYGCTKEQWEQLRAMDEDYKKTPLAAYHTFKNNFNNLYSREEFELSLWEWWEVWKTSGRWGQHTRGSLPDGMHVMGRVDLSKPLTKDNAMIIQFGQLLKIMRAGKGRNKKDPVQ